MPTLTNRAENQADIRAAARRLLDELILESLTRPGVTEIRIRIPINHGKFSLPRGSVERTA
ncbi:MAG: hypothetical protein KF774_02445 [Planctomyces sp.]|nr:hypothetical protein [Planctomyces sp.]